MNMTESDYKWLSLSEAAKEFGYSHKNSLSARLRQLRRRGQVIDLGRPPTAYAISAEYPETADKVVLLWPHPKTALLRSNAPTQLLNAKKGKRPSSKI